MSPIKTIKSPHTVEESVAISLLETQILAFLSDIESPVNNRWVQMDVLF